MKQILKYGDYNVITCSKCNCIFSFDTIDLDSNNQTTCPCCGNLENAPQPEETK